MDNIDFKILGYLLENCRVSDRQIGTKVDLTSVAVRRRIQKMIENGTIEKFTLKVEPPVLGYHMMYVIVSEQNLEKILTQIKLIGEPFIVVPCIGGITVCGIVIKEDVDTKIVLAKNLMKDMRVMSVYQAEDPEFESTLTKTDLQILSELVDNPRKKIDDIAVESKLSTKTVARAIEKFHKHNGIQFTVICNPRKMNKNIPYSVLATVEGNIKKITRKFENSFSNSFLQRPIIAKNQIVLFMYTDDIFKLDDVTQQIREHDGVKSVDLFIPKTVHYPTKWIQNAVGQAQQSPTLHLAYPINN